MKYSYTAAFFGALATTVSAHSWVEQLMVIAPNGTLVGTPGFPRGYVKRGTPAFSDTVLVNLIPPNPRAPNDIRATDPICRKSQAGTSTQSGDSPRLQAAAGANVALRYQENGHVTLPETQAGKPENRGTVYIYGTTDSKPDDTLLGIHRQWTADGQGGDKRGVLLSSRNYDDGQCYQINGGAISTNRQAKFKHAGNALMGADLWCQNDIQIPKTAPSGKPYTLYWVWDWPTMPGAPGFPEGKQEIYTTCMDVDIVAGGAATDAAGKNGVEGKAVNNAGAVNFVQGQNIANAAVANQLANIANPTAVVGKFIPFAGVPSAPSAASSEANAPAVPSAPVSSAAGGNGAAPSAPKVTTTATSAIATSTLAGNQPAPSAAGASPQNSGTAIANPNGNAATPVVPVAGSTVTQIETRISTVVQTRYETVYADGPKPTSKRAEFQTEITTVPGKPLPERSAVPCSKTENAYRLRARNAFGTIEDIEEC